MNNNRCLYCNKIIPEGRQVCPNCEKADIDVRSVTPENELCRDCNKKCKGDDCKSLKEYIRNLKNKVVSNFHKKQQK